MSFESKKLINANLKDKVVCVRSDLNIPHSQGVITDDGRILQSIKTYQYILARGCKKLIIISHMGRPKGGKDENLSLKICIQKLQDLLGDKIKFIENISDTFDDEGRIYLLENLRFDTRETSKDAFERQNLADNLAKYIDIFVLDAFGTVHRKQASIYELTKTCKSYMGFLLEKEVDYLYNNIVKNPKKPLCFILGGAKVSDKLKLINNILGISDSVLIGGGMCFTFLKSLGFDIASSLVEEDQVETAKEILENAKAKGVKIYLPQDIVLADKFDKNADADIQDIENIKDNKFGPLAIGLDIGPKTQEAFAEVIKNSSTSFLNGPMGVFEFNKFSAGTKAVLDAMAESYRNGAVVVIGGGDSAAAARTLGFSDNDFSHISTGGGASVELAQGDKLPGLEALGIDLGS